MNNRSYFPLFSLSFLLIIYGLILYLIFADMRIIDFTPFYTSSQALILAENPYPVQEKMSVNLNPPFFLLFFKPLAHLNYHLALFFWSLLSLGLGLIAAQIAFKYIFSDGFRKKNWRNLYLFYFSFFPVLMDISIVQIGLILFFFLMTGYHFYLNNKDYYAGIFWGIIISIKFFPALLFFYVLKQRRFKVFAVMLMTFLLASLIPLLAYGPGIYKQYFYMVSRILWYGDSWNASLYGFLFRQFIDTRIQTHNLIPIETLFAYLFYISLIVYYKMLGPCENEPANHQPFCLTLVMMLFLSPFGWLYYFPLLIFPLSLLGISAFNKPPSAVIFILFWVITLFLLDFPQAYVMSKKMTDSIVRIGYFSFYFYGLLLLIFQLMYCQKIYGKQEINIRAILHDEQKRRYAFAVLGILGFGLVVPLNSFLIRLSLIGSN